MKGYVSKEHDFGYVFIPKVACTSIKTALLDAEGIRPISYFKIVRKLKAKGWSYKNYKVIKRKWRSGHALVSKYRLSDIDGSRYRFLVIRDPVKRFLSAYRNRVGYHNQLSKEFILNKNPKLYSDIPIFRPSLSEFIEHFDIYVRVPTIKHHWKPFSEFLDGKDLTFFTDVYALENLKEFETKLSEIFNKEIVFRRMQTGGPKIGIENLSREELEFLIQLYKDDYELLKDYYTPELIRAEWEQKTQE